MMEGLFYEREITDEEYEKLAKIKYHNPMSERKIKVGGVYAPFTIGQIELFHYLQKLEDKYKISKDDRMANIFEDGGIQFRMTNVDEVLDELIKKFQYLKENKNKIINIEYSDKLKEGLLLKISYNPT